MRNVFVLIVVATFGLGVVGSASAEKGTGAAENVKNELVSGVQDTLVGVVQVPAKMIETAKENPVKAVTLAPIQGAKETALQTTEGAIQTGTALLPPYGDKKSLNQAEGDSAKERFGQGLKETVTGAVQVPAEMIKTAKENPVKAVTLAPIQGAKETALQTTEGAIRTATFPIPASTEKSTQTSTSE